MEIAKDSNKERIVEDPKEIAALEKLLARAYRSRKLEHIRILRRIYCLGGSVTKTA